MGKSDTISKDLLQDNAYFADTINNGLFNGKTVVNKDELVELDSTELTIIKDEVKKYTTVQKYRDVLKQATIRKDGNAIYVILGIENQTDIHYAMPVKNFFYDAMRYAKQVENARKKHKDDKMSKTEFLSGWTKSDKLIPVITLTVYYGTDEWDGALYLHDMFDDNIDKDILSLIPNYEVHLLNPNKITDWDSFKSDIGILFESISVSNQDDGMTKMIESKPEKYKHVDNKIVEAINFYTKSSYPIEEGKEKTDMCYATKTSEVCAIIRTCVYFGKSLKETIEFILSNYDGITEEYITEKYNSFSSK